MTPLPSTNAAGSAPRMRCTLASEGSLQGIGLFTGAPTRLTFHPAPQPGAGIIFRRTDLGGTPTVEARIDNVRSEQRRTVLQSRLPDGTPGPARVETVEHVLSALAGLGITDALVDIDGPEVPIDDGSAEPFVRVIQRAGLVIFPTPAPAPVRIAAPMTLGDKGSQVELLPPDAGEHGGIDGCEYIFRLDYGPNSPIAPQEARLFLPANRVDAEAYIEQVASARTFSTLAEAQAMRQMGMFAQFTPRDLLVIGPDGPIDNSLRFPDEPARHKVLDMIGDLALCGRCIVGKVIATRSGHALNHDVARTLTSFP